MKREILFRGKVTKVPKYMQDKNRMAVGDWVYGSYVDYPVAQIFDLEDEYIVDPSTVGQFTGLCDKDGKKIFEGDILYKEGHWTFYVGYEMGAFRAIPLEPVQKLNWPHCTLEEFLRVGMGDCKGFKVIGNIHDTPDLEKEEAE